jgi:type II secretory pathway pseudopilin PulG
MYQYNTPIPSSEQAKKTKLSWFTLVEIMIVILIIMMLSQLGNISSLFRHREKSQVEEIAVQLLGMIDEEKTNALLGKTQKKWSTLGMETWEIVRKRSVSVTIDNDNNNISFSSQVNLASKGEDEYEPETITKTWNLAELQWSWYECSGGNEGIKIQNAGTDTDNVHVEFTGDSLKFSSGNGTTQTPLTALHVVLKLSRNTANRELHIDRRTWLTYTRVGYPDKVLCN